MSTLVKIINNEERALRRLLRRREELGYGGPVLRHKAPQVIQDAIHATRAKIAMLKTTELQTRTHRR